MFIVEDLTHRRQLEEQLRLSEKMASLGVLAAGVAHEVNTPLTGISSYTQLLLEQLPDGSPERRMLEKIETQAFRAARIVNGLLHLSRSAPVDDAERRIVDLNAVVGDVMALLEPQLEKARIRVRSDLQPGTLPVLGFESKLQQVFLNLFINARDAMPRGGWLSVTTRGEGADAVVEVADTGTGIPPDVLERIYDPFFTTKPMGWLSPTASCVSTRRPFTARAHRARAPGSPSASRRPGVAITRRRSDRDRGAAFPFAGARRARHR
jgi:signal transduction histidine kinase